MSDRLDTVAAPDLTLARSLARNACSCAGSLLPMLSPCAGSSQAYTQLVCWRTECSMSGAPQPAAAGVPVARVI